MSTEKNISDLIEITEASDSMVLLIESDTETNKITKANLLKGINSSTVSGDISLVNYEKGSSILSEDSSSKQINGVILPTVSDMVHMQDGKTLLSDLIYLYKYNLFDKSTMISGKTPNESGAIVTNSMVYGCSDYIEVKPSTQYACNQLGHVWEYDQNKQFIKKTGWSTPFTTSATTKYIILQLYTGDSYLPIDELMLVEGSKVPGEYYPFLCYKVNSDIVKITQTGTVKSPIDGITINWVGDSMTNQKIISGYVESNYNTNNNTYANNGATMQGSAGIIDKHLKNADKNADAIVIMGGTNDAHYSTMDSYTVSLGNIDDSTIDTFCGSIHIMCQYLLENFMGKMILICSSPRRSDNVNETLKEYVEKEKEIVNSYGLPFLDLYNEYAHYAITSDGLHPSVVGGALLGRVIAKKLESM